MAERLLGFSTCGRLDFAAIFGKAVWTMPAAALATVAALEQKMLGQDHQTVLKIIIPAFEQFFIFRFVHTAREIPCCPRLRE